MPPNAQELESRKRAPLYQKKQEEEAKAAAEKAKAAEEQAAEAEARCKEARVRLRRPLSTPFATHWIRQVFSTLLVTRTWVTED